MSDDLERVARAIRKLCTKMEHEKPEASGNSDPMYRAADYARAALDALMEPSEGMVKAAVPFKTIKGHWRAMLRHILDQKDTP